MSNVIALNIVFSGTLIQVEQYLKENRYEGVSLVVPNESVSEFEDAGNRRDSIDISENKGVNVFTINGTYGYGFDIRDRFGCATEIATDGDDTAIYHLVDGFAGEVRPAEPAEKVETIKPIPDVTKLTSDDLFTVVATYDDIHAAAKVELNNRIATVKGKLE